MTLAFAFALAVQAAQADAFALRTTQPTAFAAELQRLRNEWNERPMFADGERLAQLLLADDARTAADYRRRLAQVGAFRTRINADVAEAQAGRARTEWLNGRWLNNAARTRDPDARELFRRVFGDQYRLQATAPAPIAEAAAAALTADVRAGARANADWLKGVLGRIGWFDIGRFGAEASQAAWLIVQHSDHDPEWQSAMLETLRPRVARGDMQASYYAYLVDRVAVNAGRPQTYGTQGHCVGPGDWQPKAVAEPEALDRRRSEVGLSPIADYRARFTCS